MSFLIKVISEDHTNDQYILKPLVERLMSSVGKRNAKVDLVTDPRLNGYGHAKDQIDEICEKYSFADIILFIPDRDCDEHRANTLLAIEQKKQGEGFNFFAEAAVEEVEIWLLSGYAKQLNDPWKQVRADCSVKENVFIPFLAQHGNDDPGEGRLELMRDALTQNFRGICTRCPEISDLRARIQASL